MAFLAAGHVHQEGFFWSHSAKKRAGKVAGGGDNFANTYGTVVPSSIVDSTAWWKRQAKELACICDNYECGLTQAMVTITHNNRCAEMLAVVAPHQCVREGGDGGTFCRKCLVATKAVVHKRCWCGVGAGFPLSPPTWIVWLE